MKNTEDSSYYRVYIRENGKKSRSEKQHVTPEMIRKNIAEKEIKIINRYNFMKDSHYLTLTFRDDPDETEAKK